MDRETRKKLQPGQLLRHRTGDDVAAYVGPPQKNSPWEGSEGYMLVKYSKPVTLPGWGATDEFHVPVDDWKPVDLIDAIGGISGE